MPTVASNSDLGLPQGHESSILRPHRDSDNPMRAWKKQNDLSKVVKSQNDAIFQLTRKVEAMRRRILGGAGATQQAGSSTVQAFKIFCDGGDYWDCYTWDIVSGTTGTTHIAVRKPAKLNCDTTVSGLGIRSETIRGVLQNYTYAASNGATSPPWSTSGNYFTRTVTVGGQTIEKNVIIPDPLNGDVIWAIGGNFGTTDVLVGGVNTVLWLDMNVDGRAWAEI